MKSTIQDVLNTMSSLNKLTRKHRQLIFDTLNRELNGPDTMLMSYHASAKVEAKPERVGKGKDTKVDRGIIT